MNENKGGPLYGIGGVTLLTVLLVLCLTLFAVLALSSSQADYRLSEKNARAVKAYYTAENRAYDLMNNAEEIWQAGGGKPSAEAFSEKLFSYDEPGYTECNVSAVSEGQGILICADVPVQDGAFLRIAVYIKRDGGASPWEVRQWQLLPPVQSESDIANLPLWLPF